LVDGGTSLLVERCVPVHEPRRLIAKATAGLFENSRLPMWIYDLGTLSFLAVNDAAIECYGHSREEFLAMTKGRPSSIRP
jgi:PAS domain-containing protein